MILRILDATEELLSWCSDDNPSTTPRYTAHCRWQFQVLAEDQGAYGNDIRENILSP